jgi:hypothetical protein
VPSTPMTYEQVEHGRARQSGQHVLVSMAITSSIALKGMHREGNETNSLRIFSVRMSLLRIMLASTEFLSRLEMQRCLLVRSQYM